MKLLFDQHMVQAQADTKTRLKQAFFNFRMYYLLPVVIAMTPAKWVADALFPDPRQGVHWMAVAIGLALALGFFTGSFFRKNRGFDSKRFYYLHALQKTLQAMEDGHVAKK